MDKKVVAPLIDKSPSYAEQARAAAAHLVEHRRQILKGIADGTGGGPADIEALLKVADAIEVAASAYVWEDQLNKSK